MKRKNWTNGPVSNGGVQCGGKVFPERFSASDRQFVKRVSAQYLTGIVVAASPIRPRVVQVLPVGGGTCRLCIRAIGSVVSATVGHALAPGVGDLPFESVAGALLQYCLQCVIAHGADGSRIVNVSKGIGAIASSDYSSRAICDLRPIVATDVRRARAIQLVLSEIQGNDQVRCLLPDISHLYGESPGQFMLNRKVPLLGNRRLYHRIPGKHGRSIRRRLGRNCATRSSSFGRVRRA